MAHHLLDLIEIDEELTAGTYSRLARQVLVEITGRGSLPVVVGGTGFYLRALLEGLSPAPVRDQTLRSRLMKIADRRPGALHRFLSNRDPEAAAKIHPNDHQKLIRAIELTLLAGQPASRTQSLPRDSLRGFAILKLGLSPERALLYRRLDERSARMFRAGLLAETKAILDAGYSPCCKPLQSLGYKQAVNVVTGKTPLADAIVECQIKTRQYAKRQMTWFRADSTIRWLGGFGDDQNIQRQALELMQEFVTHS